MDDTIFLVNTYEESEKILEGYKKKASLLNIKINDKKSFIIPIKSCFTYCKWKYTLVRNGKILCKPCIKTIKRQRLKLKKMKKLNISNKEIEYTKNSFNAYISLGGINIYY